LVSLLTLCLKGADVYCVDTYSNQNCTNLLVSGCVAIVGQCVVGSSGPYPSFPASCIGQNSSGYFFFGCDSTNTTCLTNSTGVSLNSTGINFGVCSNLTFTSVFAYIRTIPDSQLILVTNYQNTNCSGTGSTIILQNGDCQAIAGIGGILYQCGSITAYQSSPTCSGGNSATQNYAVPGCSLTYPNASQSLSFVCGGGNGGTSSGAVAGIVIGVLVIVAAVIAIAAILYWKLVLNAESKY